MTFLKTDTITVGDKTYTLSEFTALDRIKDLEHALSNELPPLSSDELADKRKHMLLTEHHSMLNMANGIALALHRTHNELTISSLKALIIEQWPNRSLNEAYHKVVALNAGEEPEPSEEPVEPGKCCKLRGILRTIWPWH